MAPNLKLLSLIFLLSLSNLSFAEEVKETKHELLGIWQRAIPFGHIDRRMIWELRFNEDNKASYFEFDFHINKDRSVSVISTSTRDLNWIIEGNLITVWNSGDKLKNADDKSLLKYEIVELTSRNLVLRWHGEKYTYNYQKIM